MKINGIQLVVLDPGLREEGGHHPAFILALLGTDMFNGDNLTLQVFAHQEFKANTTLKSVDIPVKYLAFFKTEFYRYFYESTHHPELPSFIRSLTAEYLAAMHQTLEGDCQGGMAKGGSSIILCHALGWEHAIALADALFFFKKQSGIPLRTVVILMFSPYRKTTDELYDSALYLRYKVAFKRLASCDSVSFFACDHETAKAYEHILAKQVDIIPCPFISTRKPQRGSANKVKQIILYLGDSKATKGFLALPNLLAQLTEQQQKQEERLSYIIQYTLTNTSEEFLVVDKKLKSLACLHDNVTIYDEFWSEEQLHQTLATSYALVFNYDSRVYMYQSSGVLWLAAYYNLKILLLSNNWLAREAARLKSEYTLCNTEELIEYFNNLGDDDLYRQTHCVNIPPKISAEYRAKLFGDFGGWLNSILDAH